METGRSGSHGALAPDTLRVVAIGLAVVLLSGAAAADFGVIQNLGKGKSDINADQVDGHDASDLISTDNLSAVMDQGNSVDDANLDMSGQAIVNFFGSACGTDQAVQDVQDSGTFDCVSISGSAADTYVNESGDTMGGDLAMANANLTNVGLGGITIADAQGDLDMGSNRIEGLQSHNSGDDAVRKDWITGNFVSESGDTITGDLDMDGNNLKNVDAIGNGTTRSIALSGSGGVDVPNGYLNVSGTLVVGATECASGEAILGDGTCGATGGGGTLSEVLAKGNEANTSIDMGGSSQLANITVGGTKTVAFDGSSNVEIPNGNLGITPGGSTSVDRPLKIQPSNGQEAVLSVINSKDTAEIFRVSNVSGDGRLQLRDVNNNIQVELKADGTSKLGGGNVNIPNGDLDVAADDLFVDSSARSVGLGTTTPDRMLHLNERSTGGTDPWIKFTNQDFPTAFLTGVAGGDRGWSVYDVANGTYRMQIGASGNVKIPNGDLDISSGGNFIIGEGNYIDWSGGASPRINEDASTENLRLETSGGGSDQILMRDTANSQDIARFKEGGTVEIPNGNLKMGSNRILNLKTGEPSGSIHTDVGGSNYASAFYFDDTSADDNDIAWIMHNGADQAFRVRQEVANNNLFQVSESGNVEIPNGNLDMKSNNIVSNTGDLALDEDSGDFGTNTVEATSNSAIVLGVDSAGNNAGDFNVVTGLSGVGDSGHTKLLTVKNGGNVEIPNGNLGVGTSPGVRLDVTGGDMRYDATSGKFIYKVDNTGRTVWRIKESGTTKWQGQWTNEGYDIRDANGNNVLRFNQGGNVEIPNGNLDVGGSKVTVDGSTPKLGFGAGSESQDWVIKNDQSNNDLVFNRDGGTKITFNSNQIIAGGASLSGNLDMNGNHIVNPGDVYYGVVSLDTGEYELWNGNSGTLTIPSSGNTNCGAGVCVKNFGSNKWAIEAEMPDLGDYGGNMPDTPVCWGVSVGDNEVYDQSWGYGVRSTRTDQNSHCYGSSIDDCATTYVKSEADSHDAYAVMCKNFG